jgi:hypothetical protein
MFGVLCQEEASVKDPALVRFESAERFIIACCVVLAVLTVLAQVAIYLWRI